MTVMRRIIILVAVVAAVPVVMWSVTGLVRSYLGVPQTPFIQTTMTASPVATAPDQTATVASTDNSSVAPPEDSKTTQVPTAPSVNAASNAPTGNGNGAAQAITITSSVTPATSSVTPAVTAPVAPPAPKTAAAPKSAAASKSAAVPPAKMAMSNPATSPPPNPTPAAAPPAPAATPDSIWPAPPTASATPEPPAAPSAPAGTPNDIGSTPSVAAAAPEPPIAPSADALPQSDPIAGRVPLPRKRPSSFVIAQGGIPLPRPRPMAVAAVPNADETPGSPFDWLRNLFRSSSPAAATAEPQQNLIAH